MRRLRKTLSAITLSVTALGCTGSAATDNPSEPVAIADAQRRTASDELVEKRQGSERADDVDSAVANDNESAEPNERFVRITTALFDESPDKVEFIKTTWALAKPFANADRLGLVSGNAPIEILSHVVNDDCETPWIEVAPRGFVCIEVRAARPANKKTRSKRKKRRRALIGSYAIAAKGARFFKSAKAAEENGKSRPARGDMLRLGKTITLSDGRTFRKTDRGELIATTDIRRLWGSKFAGVELAATLSSPVAFAVSRRSVKAKVVVRRAPSADARRARSLKPRTLVELLEVSDDGSFARVGENEWVERVDLREIERRSPPQEVGESSNSRWADVDLDQQLVVVYEGDRPIFATLASTGREKDRTPTGVFRVTRKKKRTTMRSDRSRRQTYSAAVPWSTYFHEGTAFHTAYWHDSFGKARSHGCVNLSPSDARTVYDLLGPEVPKGWSVVYGYESQLGSVVQVRSARPNPIVVDDPGTMASD